MTVDTTPTITDVLAQRARKHLASAIKLLQTAQAETQMIPGGPSREVTHALDEAYVAWRKLTDQYGVGGAA